MPDKNVSAYTSPATTHAPAISPRSVSPSADTSISLTNDSLSRSEMPLSSIKARRIGAAYVSSSLYSTHIKKSAPASAQAVHALTYAAKSGVPPYLTTTVRLPSSISAERPRADIRALTALDGMGKNTNLAARSEKISAPRSPSTYLNNAPRSRVSDSFAPSPSALSLESKDCLSCAHSSVNLTSASSPGGTVTLHENPMHGASVRPKPVHLAYLPSDRSRKCLKSQSGTTSAPPSILSAAYIPPVPSRGTRRAVSTLSQSEYSVSTNMSLNAGWAR